MIRLLIRLAIVALVIAAGSGLYWVDTLRKGTPETTTTTENQQPDTWFTDFTLRNFDSPGPPGYLLRGQRLTHFQDDRSRIDKPDLDYRRGDGAPWRITARRARVGPGAEQIKLIDNVVARQKPAHKQPTILRTSRMTLEPDAGRAHTDRPVTTTGQGFRVEATGMVAYLDSDRIRLQHEVKGRYVPAQRP